MEKTVVKLQQFLPLTQETLTLALKTSTIIFAAIIVFFQDLDILFNSALRNETQSYILAIPFIITYLVYRKRNMIKATISLETTKPFKIASTNELLGAVLLSLSFLLYWRGSYTVSPLEHHIFALPIFVSGCILILFNTQTLRQLIFPIAFLFLLVPLPANILYNVGTLLTTISSDIAYTVTKALGYPVSRVEPGYMFITQENGTTIPFQISIECSGIYSQIGFLVFALLMAYLVRDKPWKKAFIFLAGIPLIYSLNVIRIISILIIGYYYGANLALTVFHLLGGWILIFLGTLLLLLTLEKLFKIRVFTNPTLECVECNPKPTKNRDFCFSCGRIHKIRFGRIRKSDVAKIVGLITTVIIVLSLQAPVFALTELQEGPAPLDGQTTPGSQEKTRILPEMISGYKLSDQVYRDEAFEQIAGQDRALMYAYLPYNDSARETIWVGMEISSDRYSLHDWEYCLVTWPRRSNCETVEKTEIQIRENPPTPGWFFVSSNTTSGKMDAYLYWYTRSTFKLDGTTAQKYVKISVILLNMESYGLQQVEEELLTVGRAITEWWLPMESWSDVALLISKSSNDLILLPVGVIVVLILFQVFSQIQTRRNNLRAYEKLSKENRLILEATNDSKKMPTLQNIAAAYEKLNHKSITTTELATKLLKAKDAGLVKREIINVQDEPLLGWKI